MGLFTKDIKTMEDLLLHGLQDIYYAEQQIIKSLPKMIEKATNRDLVTGLKGHLEETNKQVERLAESVRKARQGAQRDQVSGDRRHHQGGRRDGRRDRGQGRAGRRHRRERPGRRTLRNVSLRDPDRMGRRTRSQRDRAFPHDQPKRGEGGKHQAQYGGSTQRLNSKASPAA